MINAAPLIPAMPELSPAAAARIVSLVKRTAGISIPLEKTDLLRNRLAGRLRALGLADYDAYLARLAGPGGAEELPRLVEAMTTHTTSFFREGRQFDWLAREGIPALLGEGPREIVLWSAACSTGAELWSGGITLGEWSRRAASPLAFRLLGTDISAAILSRAERATYAEDEIAGIPAALRSPYLLRSRLPAANGAGHLYRIVPELRSRARFLRANLLELDRAPRWEADIAFLRNVLIYFDRDDQARAAAAVASRLRPGGYLLTGHAEALFAPPEGLVQVGASIYHRRA